MNPSRTTGFGVFLAAGLAMAIALTAQHVAGLSPCALCLLARWPYRIAMALGLLAMIASPRLARILLMLALGCFLADVAVSVLHLGVESGWWKSPLPECAAPDLSRLSGRALLAALPAEPTTPCDAPVYLIPSLPISMVEMSLSYAIFLSAALSLRLWYKRRA